MTRLVDGQPVTLETAVLERSRPIVAENHARYLIVRLKGDRQGYPLPWDKLLWICRHREAEQLMRERQRRTQQAARRVRANR